MRKVNELRSQSWFAAKGLDGLGHRSAFRMQGYDPESFVGRPLVGIINSWSEAVGCNAHLRDLAEHVKRGVLTAGGFPVELPVMSLGEPLMKPTTMLYRNLMSMAVEELISANPLDAVVLLAGCDKTVPASLMGAASADVPAILVTGGPMMNGRWRREDVGACTDCWRLHDELRAGRITDQDWLDIEDGMCRSVGHCSPMGTASTMGCLGEALGMSLPGGAAIPAVDARRGRLAERSGARAVALATDDLRPSAVMSPAAFDNAIRVLHAVGGSTNAVIHLIAIAGRLGIRLPLERFDELSSSTPLLVNLKPSGEFLMEDFFHAGGVPAVMAEIADLLALDERTVAGQTLGAQIGSVRTIDDRVIRHREDPLRTQGSLAVLRGNLCPDGAVLKVAAASPSLLQHEGRAVVFHGPADIHARIDDPSLEINPNDILVMQSGGPVGAPGMPETGHLPIPTRLLHAGVSDMVRISDARMSGTGFGTVVLHVSPESAVGGLLGLVETGDRIRLDTAGRRLDLLVAEDVLAERRRRATTSLAPRERGYLGLYRRTVLQAHLGCDMDFLVGGSPVHDVGRTH